VPVTHVVERLPAPQPLVSRPEVDLGVLPAARVVVPTVDVDPDAAEAVDDLAKALEVDRDDVVDGQVRQRANGFERALRPAVRVRRVDPVDGAAAVRAAHLDDQVARERERRHRLGLRVGAEEHDRVGARRRRAVLGPVVVADHEGVRGRVRRGDVQLLERDLDLLARREVFDCGERFEVDPSGRPEDQARADDDHQQEDPGQRATDAPWALRLPVARDGREHAGWEHRAAVAVDAGRAAKSSL
jgi:hypothetical protein